MQRRNVQFTVLILLAIMAMPAVAATPWQGSKSMEDGIPLVKNPITPMEADITLDPEKAWHLGQEDGENDLVFGLITAAVVDDAGLTYLLDSTMSTIYVIGPDGSLLRTVGQEGDGPGEFRNAREMIALPDGNLGLMEMMSSKIVVIQPDGTPHPSIHVGAETGMNHLNHIEANSNGLAIGNISTTFADGSASVVYKLAFYEPDGSVRSTLLDQTEVQEGGGISLDIGGDNAFISSFRICPDDRVIVFREDYDYKLEVYGSYGNLERVIRRDYEHVKRSREDTAEIEKRNKEMMEQFPNIEMLPPDPNYRDITDVFARPNGDIWVQNSQGNRDRGENMVGFFDVFDAEGRYLRRVGLSADYDPERDLFAFHENYLFVFKEAQFAPARTTTTGGGGGMMMVMEVGGRSAEEEDDGEEAKPYEVICYRID
jgi:hypothetical protein